MATADQLQREADRRAAAAQADYLARVQVGSAAGGRVSPDTAVAGAEAAARAATGQGATMSQKPWEAMTPLEKQTALSTVDWAGLGQLTGTTPKPLNTSSSSSSTGGGSSGGGGGGTSTGGGGGGGTTTSAASNVDQTSAMYAKALEELMRQYGVSQENILASIGRMKADPYNTANAYAGMQLAGAQVAADPLAQYMQAAGMSPGQSAAAQQMAQAEADAYLRAMQNVQNVMSTSQQQANLSRMADIGLIETGATQDLESNLNMLRLGLERDRLGALTGLQQRNLENDLQMRNAIANQISNVFAGQNVAPESILKLIEAALAKMNTNRWTGLPAFGV